MIDINFISPTGGIVKSVNGKTGRVELTAADVGAATQEYVDNAVGSIEIPEVDFTGYATEEYVAQKIAEAELAEGDVDLSAYYTKSETDKAIKTAVDAIPEPDLSDYAKKSEIPSTSGLASITYVNEQIENIPEPDFTGYATEEYVGQKIAEAQLGGSDVDLSGYYTKTETDAAIKKAVDEIDIPETDLSNYYNKQEVDAKIPDTSGFALKTEIPSLEGYAKTTDIPDVSGFLTEVPAEYVTETELEEALANIPTGGGGGSVDIDGVSIVENEDGTISTSIGVHKTGGVIYQNASAELTESSWGYYETTLPGAPTKYNTKETYNIRLSIVYFDDSTYDYVTDVMPSSANTLMFYNIPGPGGSGSYIGSITGETLGIGKCPAARIINFSIGTPEVIDNTKIPARAVPVDGVTIYVEDGVLKANIPASGEEVSY